MLTFPTQLFLLKKKNYYMLQCIYIYIFFSVFRMKRYYDLRPTKYRLQRRCWNTSQCFILHMCTDALKIVGMFIGVTRDLLCLNWSIVSKEFNANAWNYWLHFLNNKLDYRNFMNDNRKINWFYKHVQYIQKAHFFSNQHYIPFEKMTNLNFVEFSRTDLFGINNPKLMEIVMSFCQLRHCRFNTPNVTSITVHNISVSEDEKYVFECLKNLPKLKKLKIVGLKNLHFDNVDWIQKVTEITLSFGRFQTMEALANAKNLVFLEISNNSYLTTIQGLDKLPLEILVLSRCKNLTDISNICKNDSHLQIINFDGCSQLTNIIDLNLVKNLSFLHLNGTLVNSHTIFEIKTKNPSVIYLF